MFGKVVWPAAIVAFGVDLLADLAFHNAALNLATFTVVFIVVALARFSSFAAQR